MDFFERYRVNNGLSHYYRVYDRNGKYLYDVDQKNELQLTVEYLKGVTCFVVNQKGEVLIEKRAKTKVTPGKLDLVSGHVDNMEIGRQSVIRELNEEVGIDENISASVKKIDEMPLSFESSGKFRNFIIEFYCLLVPGRVETTAQYDEVAELKWVPMELAFEMIRSGKTKFPKQSQAVNYEKIFKKVKAEFLSRNENNIEKKVIDI